MKYLFVLNKGYSAFGLCELKQYLNVQVHEQLDHFVIASSEYADFERLAFVQEVHEFLASPLSLPNDSYKILFSKGQSLEQKKQACKEIFGAIRKPVVDVNNPAVKYGCIVHKDKRWMTRLLYENSKAFLGRGAHTRPRLHPSAMQPQFVRFMLNCAGRVDTIYDPFCGSGGFLIEGMHCHLQMHGLDIDPDMINRAKENILHEQESYADLPVPTLGIADATKKSFRAAAVVCDPPYGKNTKHISTQLYVDFLAHMKSCTKRVVISFPTKAGMHSHILSSGWKIRGHVSYYVHASLSREIFVLEV